MYGCFLEKDFALCYNGYAPEFINKKEYKMYFINKITSSPVVDYAAEELKKYLRMMMPDAGDVAILYDPEAKDGFRLGFLEDFGLKNEAEDPVLDDVVHVDADKSGGILAGSNPRSVLFAVYRFFKENGCYATYTSSVTA